MIEQRTGGRRGLRLLLTGSGFLAANVFLSLWSLRARPAHGDEPPPGYSSATAIKLAIATGQLKLVDRNLKVPETVSATRGIQYGKGGDVPLELDLYSPKKIARPVPALIFIHGGGWKGGKRDDYQSVDSPRP